MAETYTKLLSSVLDSSIWQEPDDVLRVWFTLMAMADEDGYVGASASGIAYRSRTVSTERVRECLEMFQKPDTDSRTTDFEGRRIQRVQGGYLLLNLKRIRNMHCAESRKEQKKTWWNNNRSPSKKLDTSESSVSSVSSECLVSGPSVSVSVSDLSSLTQRASTAGTHKQKTDPPECIVPNCSTLAMAKTTGRDWPSDWETCRDWHLAKGERKVDWQATLRNWMKKSVEFEKDKTDKQRPSTIRVQKNDETNRIIPNRVIVTEEDCEEFYDNE
jgi:hypothetical protein